MELPRVVVALRSGRQDLGVGLAGRPAQGAGLQRPDCSRLLAQHPGHLVDVEPTEDPHEHDVGLVGRQDRHDPGSKRRRGGFVGDPAVSARQARR